MTSQECIKIKMSERHSLKAVTSPIPSLENQKNLFSQNREKKKKVTFLRVFLHLKVKLHIILNKELNRYFCIRFTILL